MFLITRNKLGYTLAEMVTTVAIIGTLTAVTVPNFLRVKMNANFELVKQRLKVMGQEINDLYNRTKKYPNVDEILVGTSDEELSITASINAIEAKGYELLDLTPPNRSAYLYRIQRMSGMENVALDKCLILDSFGVHELEHCWGTEGLVMQLWFGKPDSFVKLSSTLSDSLLRESEKVSILSGWLIEQAMTAYSIHQTTALSLKRDLGYELKELLSSIPAVQNSVLSKDIPGFEILFQKAVQHLEENGVRVYLEYGDTFQAEQIMPYDSRWVNEEVKAINIGFDFDLNVARNSQHTFSSDLNAYWNQFGKPVPSDLSTYNYLDYFNSLPS